MGCDIHLVTQVRGEDGKWRTVDVEKPCYCVRKGTPGKLTGQNGMHDCYLCNGKLTEGLYEGRNYDLFGILADVRNGSHGEEFIPISKAKGLPEDLQRPAPPGWWDWRWDSNPDDGHLDGTWLGDHSWTWLTLRELLEYPHWKTTVKKRGGIHMEGFKEWVAQGRGEPRGGYFGSSGGGGSIQVDNATMHELIARGEEYQKEYAVGRIKAGLTPNYWTYVEWYETYANCAENFYKESIPALQALGDPDNVRIVFGFDS